MSEVTLQQLVLSAKRFSDMENSNFIADSEWIDYINFGLRQYWNKINQTVQDYNLQEDFFQLENNKSDYDLPIDFMYTRGIDVSVGPVLPSPENGQYWMSISPYDFKERGSYTNPWFIAYSGQLGIKYRIMSTFIRFLPSPVMTNWIRHSYIPVSPVLTSPADTINGYNGFEEYAAAWAAQRALAKEESDTTNVEKIIATWEQVINTYAQDRNRDIGDRVSDIYRRGWMGWV